MLLLLLLIAPALAEPTLIRVTAPGRELEQPVRIFIDGGGVALRDDGQTPDAIAADGIWSGVFSTSNPSGNADLIVKAGDTERASGTIELPTGALAEVDLLLDTKGGFVQTEALIDPSVEAPVDAAGAAPGSVQGTWSWAVAALGWGLALSVGLRRWRTAPKALATLRSPMGGRTLWVPADARAVAEALDLLLADHRVLLAGGTVEVPPGAPVFAADSGDPGDVAAAMRALVGRGRPVAILASQPPPGALAALQKATQGSPLVVVSSSPPAGASPLLQRG
ncbi:MAG: choice-of-anchor X domain-containing protein [Myxococcota bacterium]|nr:choice-of-anchor X domain-containing protein [Myxococcota bacterium]